MYTIPNLSAVSTYVSGRKLDPHEGVQNEFDLQKISEVKYSSPSTLDVTSMLEDTLMCSRRWNSGVFDARDALVGVHKGARLSTQNVGRTWNASAGHYDVKYSPGLNWGDSDVALVPAIAALASTTVDNGSVSAWGTLHQLLGIAGQVGPVDRDLMVSLHRLHGSNINTVRFVHRLAALFWHACWAPSKSATVEIRRAAQVEPMGGVPAMLAHLAQGVSGQQYVPWFAPGEPGTPEVYSVLFAAAAGKVVGVGPYTSRALKMWPDLGSSGITVLVDGLSTAAGLRSVYNVTLTPGMVWYAAQRWCARYSDVALFDEAVQFVGAMITSPGTHGCNATSDPRVLIPLPLCNMGALALGPLANARSELSLGSCPRLPSIPGLVEKAVVTSLLLGLSSWFLRWRVLGWFYAYGFTDNDDAAEYCRRFLPTNTGPGAALVQQAYLEHVGINGNLGRLFGTVSSTSAEPWKHYARRIESAPQWEELVSRTRKIPTETAIYGLLYPLLPTERTFFRSRWHRISELPTARTADHALYGLISRGAEFAISRDEDGMRSSSVPFQLFKNYRGSPADYQCFSGVDKYQAKFEPVFRVSDKIAYYEMMDKEHISYQKSWYVEIPDGAPLNIPRLEVLSGPSPATTVINAPLQPIVVDSDDSASETDVDVDSEYSSEKTNADDHSPQPHSTKQTPTPLFDHATCTPREFISNMASTNTLPQIGWDKGCVYALDLMYDRGVRKELCDAFATMIKDGVPASHQASPAFDVLLNNSMYDALVDVERQARVVNAERIERLYINVLKNTPPGSSAMQVLRQAMGASSAKAGLGRDGFLSGEEMIVACGPETLANLGLLEKTTNSIGQSTYKQTALYGRLPSPAVCKQLINSGRLVSQGLGNNLGYVPTTMEVPQDSVADLVRVMIESAYDAGEKPDLDMIASMVPDTINIHAIHASIEAARNLTKNSVLSVAGEGSGRSSSQTGAVSSMPVGPSFTSAEEVVRVPAVAHSAPIQPAITHGKTTMTAASTAPVIITSGPSMAGSTIASTPHSPRVSLFSTSGVFGPGEILGASFADPQA